MQALFRTVNWLPVKARIQYKTACLCFQCMCQNRVSPYRGFRIRMVCLHYISCLRYTILVGNPRYISNLLHPYCLSRMLHSLEISLLTVPRFSLETFGKRSFSVFGPTVWNSVPLSLRKTQCFTTFKKKLKTHLFHIHLC